MLKKYEETEGDQMFLSLPGNDDDAIARRQRAADRRHWQSWLANVDADLVKEPQRVADFYRVKSFRLEPVGLAYLWPVTG